MDCFHCKKTVSTDGRPGRGEACPHCGSDVRVCLNCKFFDPGAYNACKEPQAERVLNKDRATFCEFFEPGTGNGQNNDKNPLEELERLFKA